MTQAFPNLAGVATQELVEKIGSGKYVASYINWSRTINLLREHAPGWLVEAVPASDGSLLHRAPVGGYLLIRFRGPSGVTTPEVPQAIMDSRNAAIPFEKITARDITDTHRRGACLAAAMTFGLAYELWAKDPLSSGYSRLFDEADTLPEQVAKQSSEVDSATIPATKEQFLEAALTKGLTTHAAEALAAKLKQNYSGGIARLAEKDQAWVDSYNEASNPKNAAGQW